MKFVTERGMQTNKQGSYCVLLLTVFGQLSRSDGGATLEVELNIQYSISSRVNMFHRSWAVLRTADTSCVYM